MQPYASFWRRLAAFLIDCLVISIPSGLMMGALFITRMPAMMNAVQAMEQTQDPSPEAFGALMSFYGLIMLGNLVSLVIFWLYYSLMESGSRQATLGKMALGIKVVGPDGGRLSFGRATGRTLSKLISYTILYFGFFMAAFTKKRQALHDIIAATYVVNEGFKQGDALPEEKFKPGCLILSLVVIITPIVLWAALIFAGIAAALSEPAASSVKSNMAISHLKALAATQLKLEEPMQAGGWTLASQEDGLTAVPTADPAAYTLLLPTGEDEVCCQPGEKECPADGPEICN